MPIERELARTIGGVVRDLAGSHAYDATWERCQRAALNAMRRLALTQRLEPHEDRARDLWPDLRESLVELVLAPAPDAVSARRAGGR